MEKAKNFRITVPSTHLQKSAVKPLSAWERRKQYSKQMIERRQSSKNLSIKNLPTKSDLAKSVQKRKLDAVNSEEKENIVMSCNEIPMKRKRSGTFTFELDKDNEPVADASLCEARQPDNLSRKRKLSATNLTDVSAKKRKSSPSQEKVASHDQELPVEKSALELPVLDSGRCVAPSNNNNNDKSPPNPGVTQSVGHSTSKTPKYPVSKTPGRQNSKTTVAVSNQISMRQKLSLWKKKKQEERVVKKDQVPPVNRRLTAPAKNHLVKGSVFSNLAFKDNTSNKRDTSVRAFATSKVLDKLPPISKNAPSKRYATVVPNVKKLPSSIQHTAKNSNSTLNTNHPKVSAISVKPMQGTVPASLGPRNDNGKSERNTSNISGTQKQSVNEVNLNAKQAQPKHLSKNLTLKNSTETTLRTKSDIASKQKPVEEKHEKKSGKPSSFRRSISSMYRSGKLASVRPLSKEVTESESQKSNPVKSSSVVHGQKLAQPKKVPTVETVKEDECPSSVNGTIENENSLMENTRNERSESVRQKAKKTPHQKKSVSFQIGVEEKSCRKLPKTPIRGPSLRERLESWLDKKCCPVDNYRHLHCFGLQLSELKKQNNSSLLECNNFEETNPNDSFSSSPLLRSRKMQAIRDDNVLKEIDVDSKMVLLELKSLLKKGNPPTEVRQWLHEIIKKLPFVQNSALYWECQALTAEMQGRRDEALAMFQMALDRGAEPSEDLAVALSEFLIRTDNSGNKENTPIRETPSTPHSVKRKSSKSVDKQLKFITPRRPLLDKRNMFSSTKIKLRMTRNTPVLQRIAQALEVDSLTVHAVVTPVRRSSRLSVDLKTVQSNGDEMYIKSLDELPENLRRQTFFIRNKALDEIDLD